MKTGKYSMFAKSEEIDLNDELARERTEEFGFSQVHELARQGDIAGVKQYLQVNPDHLNHKDVQGASLACIAAERNDGALFEYLASLSGINLKEEDLEGSSPMMWAKKNGNKQIQNLIQEQTSIENSSPTL